MSPYRHPPPGLKVVDFFCGAGGMSCGLRQAGLDVVMGIDNDRRCEQTYRANHPAAAFLLEDVTTLAPESLGESGITQMDDGLVFVGCSPCQYWTTINTDKRKAVTTKGLLPHFQRFVEHFKPGYVVVENVPGLMHKASRSGLHGFVERLRKLQYAVATGIVNANHYGVPQNRLRFLLVGTRVHERVCLPTPDSNGPVVRDVLGDHNGIPAIAPGHRDETGFLHSCTGLSQTMLERLALTPKDGGTREAWKDHDALQINAYRGKDECFKDVYGRLFWDKPSSTITTRFISLSNGRFGHPQEDRALSLREGAILQSFPRSYCFLGNGLHDIARQIGNAVPPALARRVGRVLLSQHAPQTQEQAA